ERTDFCPKHREEGELLKFKCITCNQKICRVCSTQSHFNHVKKIILAEDFPKKKPGFPWKNEQEVNEYLDQQFDNIKKQFTDEKDKILFISDEIMKILVNIQTICHEKYQKLENDIEFTKALLKTSYMKFYKELNESVNINFNMKKQEDYYIGKIYL